MSAENSASPHALSIADGLGWDIPIFGPFGSGLISAGAISPLINGLQVLLHL